MTVISFEKAARERQTQDFLPISLLKQQIFCQHEIRSIGDIRTELIMMGFTKDPTYSFCAYPDETGINNKMVLDIDVADSYYASIFGEAFQISIMKFEDQNGSDFYKMETPLSKSSGTFGDVIEFVENFINTNLRSGVDPIRALVCSPR